jgi:hypothetical protein
MVCCCQSGICPKSGCRKQEFFPTMEPECHGCVGCQAILFQAACRKEKRSFDFVARQGVVLTSIA